MVFQPIDQSLDPLAEAVDGTVKGTGQVFILLSRDGDADTMASQVLPILPTVGLVTYQTTRPTFGAPPRSVSRLRLPSELRRPRLRAVGQGEDQRHQLAPAFRADMDFRTEAALTATRRASASAFLVWAQPRVDARGRWCHPHSGYPSRLPCGVGLLLDRGKEANPDACLAPAVEAAGDGGPAAIPLGQVTPGGTGTEDPQDAVEDASWSTAGRPV